jgi:cholesterol transport system auxiliary component
VTRRRLAIAVLALAAVGLSGCISLFPKTEPAQLYRFQAEVTPTPVSGPLYGVLRVGTGFPRAAAGDRILTVSPGGEAAYIAGARWISPSVVLFDEAVGAAFQDSSRVRLVSRGEVTKAEFALKLEVETFEVVYDAGPKAAPKVVVKVRALVSRSQDRTLVGDKAFTAEVRAGENRVGAIVPAFNLALTTVLGQLVEWTNGLNEKSNLPS